MLTLIQNYLVRSYLLFKGAYIYNTSVTDVIEPLKEMDFTLDNDSSIKFVLYCENRKTIVYRFGFFKETSTKHYVIKAIFSEELHANLAKFNSLKFSTGYSLLSFFPEDKILMALMGIFLDYLIGQHNNA